MGIRRRGSVMVTTLAVLAGLLAGCASVQPRNAVPKPLINMAQPVGFDDVRFWGDYNDPGFIEHLMIQRARSLDLRFGDAVANGERPSMSFLAISGGGQYGAFTAGLLNGWTEAGSRPVFEVVSGISTGSIIAPFAFLGSEYDDILREVYTTTSTEDMLRPKILSGLIGGSSLADTTPLRNKIAQYVTPELLAAIAEQYRAGRLLFVGTTNLDAGRPVIWNMGAIADSGHPGALQLFRDVILASAAIPIAFPPVFFDVEADGVTYEEMHVDGGVTSQVNILSPQVPAYLMDDLVGFDIDRRLYVILNGSITPLPAPVRARVPQIGGASLNTLWYAQAVGDLYRLLTIARRDNFEPQFTWIPPEFTDEPTEPFDPVFMNTLFELGRQMALDGTAWSSVPPNYTARGTTAVERGTRALPDIHASSMTCITPACAVP